MQPSCSFEECRVVIDSVGTANAGIVGVLERVLPGTSHDIAKLVYQAPAELVAGLRPGTAESIAGLLREAGLKVTVAGPELLVRPGAAEFEVALVVEDPAVLPELVRDVAVLLGVDVTTARRLVCSTPAVVLGNVSSATVDAMRNRYAHLPVTVDVSRAAAALYYMVLGSSSPAVLSGCRDVVRRLVPPEAVAEGPDMLTVGHVERGTIEQLWESLQRTGAQCTICNLDFERYDVVLDTSGGETEMADVLREVGIPAELVPRVFRSLPVALRQNASHSDAISLIERIARAGGEATAVPYSTNRFGLSLQRITDPLATARSLELIGGLAPHEASEAVHQPDGPVGAFTKTTARWLQHDLCSVGTRARMVQR